MQSHRICVLNVNIVFIAFPLYLSSFLKCSAISSVVSIVCRLFQGSFALSHLFLRLLFLIRNQFPDCRSNDVKICARHNTDSCNTCKHVQRSIICNEKLSFHHANYDSQTGIHTIGLDIAQTSTHFQSGQLLIDIDAYAIDA